MTGCILEALNDELPCLQNVVIVQTEGPLYLSYVAVTKHNELPKLIIIHRNYKAVYSKSLFVWVLFKYSPS